MKYFGGCDVGSTYTKAVILDENGKMCAFPIQQLLIHLFGGQMNVYLHMGLALVIATAVGVVLHYTTEK